MLDKNKLKAKIVEKKTNIEEISNEIGINKVTFYRKMANNSFCIKEVDLIMKFLSLSKEEAISIFFS